MTFGFRTFTATGSPILSEQSAGGVFIGYISHGYADSNSYAYPALAGKTLRVLQMMGSAFIWSVSYAAGYPVIQISELTVNSTYSYSASLELLVFAS